MAAIREIMLMGSGTSTGVPEVGCYCATCLSSDPRDKRTRTALLLTTDEDKRILIDCGPDFREQAIKAGIDRIDAIILTHEHYDHIGGLDDLRTIAWRNSIKIYASARVIEAVKYRLHYYFGAHPYPGTPRLELIPIGEDPFQVEGLRVLPIQVKHGKLPIQGFRIEDFVFFTDVKTTDPNELAKANNPKLLFVNALRYTKPHGSHQTIEQAVAMAKQLSAKQTYIIHLSHHAPIYTELQKRLPEGIAPSYDGLTLKRLPDGSFRECPTSHRALGAVTPYEFHNMGRIPYHEAYTYQKQLFDSALKAKSEGRNPMNHLLFCEHDPVFTLGKHGHESNLLIPQERLDKAGIELIRIERGGDITYHGPGQITAYPIFDLTQFNMGIKEYIYTLEQCVIDTLFVNSIRGERMKGATGVWIDVGKPSARKICAIGVYSSRYITMHGIALNVFTDMEYFHWINPCGFTDKGVTSIEREMHVPTSMALVELQLEEAFRRHFSQALMATSSK